jgi:hypothetical protein
VVVAFFRGLRTAEGAGMLMELQVGEQRYRAVWEVLEGASVTEVARRFGVSRQSVHVWLRRYAAEVVWRVWVIGRRGRSGVRIR